MLVIHFIDKKQFGDSFFRSGGKCLFAADRDAAFAGNDDDGAARGADALAHAAGKVKQTRRVQQIDLDILPLDRQNGGGHGRLAADLLGIKITDRIAVRDTSETVGLTGKIKGGFSQRRFARAGMTHQGDIADVFGIIRFHRKLPFLSAPPVPQRIRFVEMRRII